MAVSRYRRPCWIFGNASAPSVNQPVLCLFIAGETWPRSLSICFLHPSIASAGVGRSGTFIAVDALLETAEHQDTVDILDFTHRMRWKTRLIASNPNTAVSSRQNRVYMIQTVDQYVFLYRTLIEGILTIDTPVSLPEYMATRNLRMDLRSQYKVRLRRSSFASHLTLSLPIAPRTIAINHRIFISRGVGPG